MLNNVSVCHVHASLLIVPRDMPVLIIIALVLELLAYYFHFQLPQLSNGEFFPGYKDIEAFFVGSSSSYHVSSAAQIPIMS